MFTASLSHSNYDTRTRQWLTGAGILSFALLTALGAQITIWSIPVPVTLQVLVVLLSGLVLGARAGAASQLTYLGMILMGAPFAAGGIGGAGVFLRPTAGYLVGFVLSAWLAGWLAEAGFRRQIGLRLLAGIAGLLPIYALGLGWLKFITTANWQQSLEWGFLPFWGIDLLKAIVAAILAECGYQLLARYGNKS